MKSTVVLSFIRYMSRSKKSVTPTVEKLQGPILSDKSGNIILHVFAKPGAKSNGISAIQEEGVAVQIGARAVDGEANTELVKYMMSVLGLKKNEISLEKGMKARQKVLLITKKDFTPEKVTEMLKLEMKK